MDCHAAVFGDHGGRRNRPKSLTPEDEWWIEASLAYGIPETELKQRLTADDWQRLILYRNKRGPLNPLLRADAGFALVAASIFNAQGAKRADGRHFDAADFLPWAKEEEAPATAQDAFMLLSSIARGKH